MEHFATQCEDQLLSLEKSSNPIVESGNVIRQPYLLVNEDYSRRPEKPSIIVSAEENTLRNQYSKRRPPMIQYRNKGASELQNAWVSECDLTR